MLKKCLFIAVFVVAVFGLAFAGMADAQDVSTIYLTKKQITVKPVFVDGVLTGVDLPEGKNPLIADEIKSFQFVSDRVGWNPSIAYGFYNGKKAAIRPIANNDFGQVEVVDIYGMSYPLILSEWNIVTKNVTYEIVPDQEKGEMLKYGNYQPMSISVNQPDEIIIDWGSNLISGIDGNIRVASKINASWVGWESLSSGQGDACTVRAKITRNKSGNYRCSLVGATFPGFGKIFIRQRDGLIKYINVDGGWTITADAGLKVVPYPSTNQLFVTISNVPIEETIGVAMLDEAGAALAYDGNVAVTVGGVQTAIPVVAGNGTQTSDFTSSTANLAATAPAVDGYEVVAVEDSCAGTLVDGGECSVVIRYKVVEEPPPVVEEQITISMVDEAGAAMAYDGNVAVNVGGVESVVPVVAGSGTLTSDLTDTSDTVAVTPPAVDGYDVYSFVSSCGGTLENGATCTFTLTYQAVEPPPIETLTIAFNGDGTADIGWSGDVLSGLVTEGIDPAQVVSIGWASELTGWGATCSAIGAFEQLQTGMSSKVAGIPTVDHLGNFLAILADGSAVYFNTKADWEITVTGGTFSVDPATGLIVLNFDELPPPVEEPTISVSNGTARIAWASETLDGFVSVVNPADVEGVYYASNNTGWGADCGARGTLATDTNGNYYSDISGIPLVNHSGLFFIRKTDGTQVWLNSAAEWTYVLVDGSITVGSDGLLVFTYDAPQVMTVTFSSAGSAEIAWNNTALLGLMASGIDPTDVEFVGFGSPQTGWGTTTVAKGSITVAQDGTISCTVTGLPTSTASGNFFIWLKSTQVPVWFNLAGGWEFTAPGGIVIIDLAVGIVTYSF